MKILAKTIAGNEFIYSASSAHKVNAKNAEKIASCLNQVGFLLKGDEIWHVYEVEDWENAYLYAETQSFYFTKSGSLRRRSASY